MSYLPQHLCPSHLCPQPQVYFHNQVFFPHLTNQASCLNKISFLPPWPPSPHSQSSHQTQLLSPSQAFFLILQILSFIFVKVSFLNQISSLIVHTMLTRMSRAFPLIHSEVLARNAPLNQLKSEKLSDQWIQEKKKIKVWK